MEKGLGDIARKLTGKEKKTPNYRSKEFAERRMQEYGGNVEDWMKNPNPESATKYEDYAPSSSQKMLKAFEKYFMLEKKAKKYKNIKDKIKSKDPKHQQQAYEQLKPREAAFFATSPKAKHVAAMDAHKAEHGKFPWEMETES